MRNHARLRVGFYGIKLSSPKMRPISSTKITARAFAGLFYYPIYYVETVTIFTFRQKKYNDGMRFIKGTAEQATEAIADRLIKLLSTGHSVLWLVSGGSNISIQTEAMQKIPEDLTRKLTIMPVDERYGPYNHTYSNAAQMRRSGFEPKRAEWIDILEGSESLEDTTRLLNDYMARKIAVDDYIFATLGLGAEGHTAGILPHSPALHCTDFVVSYKADDFIRITLCADTLAAQCDEAIVSAFGETKHQALQKLADSQDDRDSWPGDLLHEISNCTVYNDSIEKEML